MLQLVDICKSYTTANFTQTALDHVSVSFRDNEFVAILGPSGSGKTTLLNVIGGLDHYDSGNLIIDGISTEQYSDRDWDAFRNNRVGFVFQSYNLIPHQTVLANVELALTLSGVPRDERRKRAVEALEKVGLGEHVDKKPSQLSGGQMQRVAIARALINDPEILLADEPTGALDSKTSVQIMDLLTEIAKDRLVVMVTHNPELAEQYATRIVNLADGVIRSDTDPFDPASEPLRLSEKPTRRTHMSLPTALSLSFKNLMTKKGRTFMTAFAGSIGIIGIAAILALANGVNDYIESVEEETLSQYPLEIQSSGFDMTSLMVSSGIGDMQSAGGNDGNASNERDGSQVGVAKILTSMLSSIGSNDLASLKEYFDSGESGIEEHVNAIEYSYNVTPQIYSANTDTIHQVNPDKSFSSLGLGSSASTNSLMSMSMSTDVFYELPENSSLYEGQYDVKAGRWPQSYDECVLVLTQNGSISDLMQYTLGLRDSAELNSMVQSFMAEEEVETPDEAGPYDYDEIVGTVFKMVNAVDYYAYDEEFKVWTDKSDNTAYMRDLVKNGEDLTVVGIVQPTEDADATMLSAGIYYPRSLTQHIVEAAEDSQIVKDQLADPAINVFTGKPFGEEDEDGEMGLESLFTINGEALQAAFTIDESALATDMSGMSIDLSNVQADMSQMPAFDASSVNMDLSGVDLGDMSFDMSGVELNFDGMEENIDSAVLSKAMGQVMKGFMTYYTAHSAEYIQKAAAANADKAEDEEKVDPTELALNDYLASEEAQGIIAQAVSEAVNMDDIEQQVGEQLQAQLSAQMSQQMQEQVLPALQQAITAQMQTQLQGAMQSYMQQAVASMMSQITGTLTTQVNAAMQQSMAQMSANMANAMSIDESAFANAFEMNMTEEEMSELIMSLMSTEEASYDNNLKKLGYADFDKPSGIKIYPKNFESKEHVIEILDAYNDRMEAEDEDKVITYTDFVGALMSSVTNIVNMISYVLVAFVSISLVVSSIMIGVITYISVLERKKEIGILRAIGASKGDVGRVFNAETIIIGLVAGLLGVGITALACIPVNALVFTKFAVPNVAILPWQAACMLVAISVVLTFIAGLIPARGASRKDPVEALRSE